MSSNKLSEVLSKLKYKPKQEFIARLQELLQDEIVDFFECMLKQLPTSIRVNTLKIDVNEALSIMQKWQPKQVFNSYPEALIIQKQYQPGELGNSIEHKLGYFYIQEISSMLAGIAVDAKPYDVIVDVCAAPGSKTTQIAAAMQNKGLIIANDVRNDRIKILLSNIERIGVSNCIVTKMSGIKLLEKLPKLEKTMQIKFNKILLDVPCSGEGTIRSNQYILQMWNINMIKRLAALQKKLLHAALLNASSGTEIVYSTCTLTPEENEEVIQYALDNFDVKLVKPKLPSELKLSSGITEWKNKVFSSEMRNAVRLWPHHNNTEGFFIAKLVKL